MGDGIHTEECTSPMSLEGLCTSSPVPGKPHWQISVHAPVSSRLETRQAWEVGAGLSSYSTVQPVSSTRTVATPLVSSPVL